jgi:hypothetical protein
MVAQLNNYLAAFNNIERSHKAMSDDVPAYDGEKKQLRIGP